MNETVKPLLTKPTISSGPKTHGSKSDRMAEILGILHETVAKDVPVEAQATMEAFLTKFIQAESGGNIYDQSSKSSAAGLFGFTKGTFQMYAPGQNIFDPRAQCEAAVQYSLDNGKKLRKALGREPTAGEYYLAHFVDGAKAVKILHAPSDTPITELLSPREITANGLTKKFRGKKFEEFTARDLVDWAAMRMDIDIAARTDYQTKHNAGKTTKKEDDAEEKKRRQLLDEMGLNLSEDTKNMLAGSGILGDIFIAIIKIFMSDTAPATEQQQTTNMQTADQNTIVAPKLPAKITTTLPTKSLVHH